MAAPMRRFPARRFLARRAAAALLVALLAVFTMGAADSNARFEKLGHQMMCPCGCNQILLECNHVGCPDSDGMRGELAASLNHGDTDSAIFAAFEQKYGPTVLAAPTPKGFNLVAWIMPFLVLTLGLGATALIVRKWRLRTVPLPAAPASPQAASIRERIRRDTEF